ncbi:tyrosine-protein phosphatase non-receptor type 1 [Vespula squamosa]|uniref:Tyrosine-protein phosphatase non-receptor type 1 n=1 Tax=Vespula squamosa TaxID=30214 RepID=A0ABD2B140_VESSQ
MIVTKVFVFVFFLAASCSYASPINRASVFQPVIAVPIFLEEKTNVDTFSNEEGKEEAIVPSILLVVGSYLNDQENLLSKDSTDLDRNRIEKRNAVVEENAKDDLDMAAGTNILRPLFVYRQQLAYRQRLREAIRRGNRF